MLDKKGISGVIVMVLMIGLVVVAVSIVWGVVNSLLSDKLSSSEACFGNFDKVTIGKRYTCFDPDNNYLRFSINIGEIDVEKVLISVSGDAGSVPKEVGKDDSTVADLTYYGVTPDSPINLPGKNEGKAYKLTWAQTNPPKMIEIAPTINGVQCDVTDSITLIDDCSTLA